MLTVSITPFILLLRTASRMVLGNVLHSTQIQSKVMMNAPSFYMAELLTKHPGCVTEPWRPVSGARLLRGWQEEHYDRCDHGYL